MKDAVIIQRTLDIASQIDVEATDVLILAHKTLGVEILCLDEEGEKPSHLLGLCKDQSLFLIVIKPIPDDDKREDWDIYSFSDPEMFERFLHDPVGEKALPPLARSALLSSYSKVHLINALEPGHA